MKDEHVDPLNNWDSEEAISLELGIATSVLIHARDLHRVEVRAADSAKGSPPRRLFRRSDVAIWLERRMK